jgi:hypothetical protein
MRKFGDQSVEAAESELMVGPAGENGIQILATGGEPYNGMQRAYDFPCYFHMGPDLMVRENLSLGILQSLATPVQSLGCVGLGGFSVPLKDEAVIVSKAKNYRRSTAGTLEKYHV